MAKKRAVQVTGTKASGYTLKVNEEVPGSGCMYWLGGSTFDEFRAAQHIATAASEYVANLGKPKRNHKGDVVISADRPRHGHRSGV